MLRAGIIRNQYRGDSLETAPAVEPVLTADVKTLLGIPTAETGQDALIAIQVKASRQYIEEMTGLAFINQTWKMTLDNWPEYASGWWDGVIDGSIDELLGNTADINLSRYPLSSVTSFTVDGTSYTPGDYFIIDTTRYPGRIVAKHDISLPTPTTEAANGIQITYVAGFGATSADVPENLRLAIMQMAAMLFSHRGDGCSVESAYRESGAKSLVQSHASRHL